MRKQVTVPRILHGTGTRIVIDRITGGLDGTGTSTDGEVGSNHLLEEFVREKLRFMECDYNGTHQKNIVSSVSDALIDTVFNICRLTGDRRWDQLISVFRNRISFFSDLFSRFDMMASICAHRTNEMKSKLQKEWFMCKYVRTVHVMGYSVYYLDAVEVL